MGEGGSMMIEERSLTNWGVAAFLPLEWTHLWALVTAVFGEAGARVASGVKLHKASMASTGKAF